MEKKTAAKMFRGTWRIQEMEQWDREYLDEIEQSRITIDDRDMGDFRFCAAQGFMDCRYGERDGRPVVEFSWEGHEDTDPASGRGWAVIEEEGVMSGRIFFHCGDDSSFRAVRSTPAKRKGRNRGRGGIPSTYKDH